MFTYVSFYINMEITCQKEKINQPSSTSTAEEYANKNSFMVSVDSFSFEEQTSEIVEDLKTILELYRKSQKTDIIKNNHIEREILERKIGKTCKKYANLFADWSQYQIQPNNPSNRSQIDFEEAIRKKSDGDINDSEFRSSESKQDYWLKPIQQTILDLRTSKPVNEKIQQLQKMPIIPQQNSNENQTRSVKSDESWTYSAEPKPLDKNPHLRTLLSEISNQMNLFVYLPSKLKITIVGVNDIDQSNERASIILKLQLKVKLPENTDDESELYRHLSQLKIKVLSKKMKNQEDNIGYFCSKSAEGEPEYNSSFYGNVRPNNDTSNFSIWTDFEKYYNINHKFQQHTIEQIKKILKKMSNFDGLIFSTKFKDVQVKVNSYNFNAPFEMLDLNGLVHLQDIQVSINDWQDDLYQYLKFDLNLNPKITIKFNLIDVGFSNEHIQHIANAGPEIQIDDYELAEKFVRVEFSDFDESKYYLRNRISGWSWCEKPKEQKNHQYLYMGDSYAHFHFPFYRHPLKGLSLIFVPTVVLGVTNIFIFFQEFYIADRIANISTLLISFIALINVLQFEIKKTPSITIASLLVHLITLTPLFCLLQTMVVYFENDGPDQPDIQPLKSVFFWLCIFITSLNLIYPICMYTIYKCIWEPSFNLRQIREQEFVLPGQHSLTMFNQIEDRNYLPIKSLSAKKKIGEWEKFVSSYVKETLAHQLSKKGFQKKMQELAKIFPKFHGFLTGKQGQLYQNILLTKKKTSSKFG